VLEQGFDHFTICIVLMNGKNVGIRGFFIFEEYGVLYWVESGLEGVIPVDNSSVNVWKDSGKLCGFDGLELQFFGVFCYIPFCSFKPGIFREFYKSICLQQKKSASSVDAVTGNCYKRFVFKFLS